MAFREISVEELKDNPFTLINKDWMLITAGNEQSHNTMTASWGGVGELWGKYVSTIYVRPQRYTLEFVEREDYYSLCFFGPEYRQALSLCGSKSGRDVDKDTEAFLNWLDTFGEKNNIKFTVTISADISQATDGMQKFL